MKKVDLIILKIFLYCLPIVTVMAIFASLINPDTVDSQSLLLRTYYNSSGLVFALWMIFSLYLSMKLVFSKPFREAILTRISFMRERDEREAHLTGRATKTVFLSTLAVLICLLCLSTLRVNVSQLPPERAINGKTGSISLGWAFGFGENSKKNDDHQFVRTFDYRGLPLSNSVLILGLLLWQIVAYNISMRRLLKKSMREEDNELLIGKQIKRG